jgi:predicted O-methyltransferase YrrM
VNLIRRAFNAGRVLTEIEDLKRQASAHLDQPAELVSLLFGFHNGIIRPLQIDEELASLVRDVRALNPSNVLEIGTARGGTLFLWTQLAKQNATIVSIDLPQGNFGGGYTRQRALLYRRFATKGQALHLLRLDSHAESTLQRTKQLFAGSPIDLLFIDGDHTFEGVKKDWEMYSSLVRAGGMIVFHDVAGNYDDTQVKRLWDSIKDGFRNREYVLNPGGQYGIGVLMK